MKNAIRQFKTSTARQRYYWYHDNYWGWAESRHGEITTAAFLRCNGPTMEHSPNKNEAKALRRIMSSTGLNEEQVRGIKKYRQELAQAAGPQFRVLQDAKKNNPDRFKSSDQIDREQVAALHFITVDHKAFPKIWARVQRERVQDAILAILGQEPEVSDA